MRHARLAEGLTKLATDHGHTMAVTDLLDAASIIHSVPQKISELATLRAELAAAKEEAARDKSIAAEFHQHITELEKERVVLICDRSRLEAELAAAKEQLELDRTQCADFLTKLNNAMDGRFWLTEGRGSYAWDDDRYREEFREAACEILAALRPMREMAANLSSRLKTTDEIVQARIDTKKRISQLEAELAAAKNETDQVTALYDECHEKFVLAENEIARLNGEVQRFDHERDALAAHVERLREAAELAECYMKVLRHELAQNNANFEGSEDEAEINGDFAKVQSALATAPAQSLAAHDAALLRRLAAESAPGERADIAPWLLAEAARLRAREGK